MSDFTSTSTTDDDAFDELSYNYSSYDSPSESTGPSTFGSPNTGGLLGNNQSWNSAWDTYYGDGGKDPYMDWLGNEVGFESANARTRAVRAQMQQEMYNRNRAQAPAHERSLQQQIPISPIDFSRPPSGPNPNFKTIVNPYVPTDAMKERYNGILNPNEADQEALYAKAAQGEQTADARSWVFDKLGVTDPKIAIDAWRKGVRSDIGDGIKTGLGAIGDGVGSWWDNMNADDANKVDPVEDFEALAMPTARNTDYDAINQARYSAFNREGILGNTGPIGPDGTNFSPDRWSPYEQMANTQVTPVSNPIPGRMGNLDVAFHKPLPTALPGINSGPMSARDRASLSRGNIDVYPENFVMIDGKPVSRNNLGSNGGADGGFNFNFNLPGIGSFSNMKGRQESSGPKNSMGFPNPYTGEVQKPSIDYDESLGIENFVNVALTVHPSGWVALFGKKAANYIASVVSRARETGISKIAAKPINLSDDVLTVTEQGLMKPTVRNKVGLGKNTPKELGKINRNAPIQGENIYTNSQILGKRNRYNAKSIPVRARDANRRGRK